MSSIARHENVMSFWSYIAQNTDQQLAATSEHVHYQLTDNHKAEKGGKWAKCKLSSLLGLTIIRSPY